MSGLAKVLGLAAMVMAAALPASALAAEPYEPPVEPAPLSKPQAFFAKDIRSGRWCVLDEVAVKAAADAGQLDPEAFGWIHYSAGGLESVTVQTESEDAVAVDRYAFERDGRVSRLVRTGGYINSPTASLIFTSDETGRLVLSPASKEVLRRMEAAGYEHYIEDWPTYRQLTDFPFARLVDRARTPPVRMGACVR